MDSGTIIISLILVILAILPFIFTGKKFRRQKKQHVNTLKGLAERNQVKLSNFEAGGSFGIGLDQNESFLFFSRLKNEEQSIQTVVLGEMTRCKLKTGSRLLDDGEKVIDRVELVLTPSSSAQPDVVLEMYNSECDTLTIRGELQTATRWEQILSAAIKENKHKQPKQSPVKKAAAV